VLLKTDKHDALKCPACHMTIPWQYVSASKIFVCPSCSSRVRVKRSSLKVTAAAGLLLAVAAASVTGATGWSLVLMAFVLSWPCMYVCGFIKPKIFGFPLEAVPTGGRVPLGDSNQPD
jgi:hypothetical protein